MFDLSMVNLNSQRKKILNNRDYSTLFAIGKQPSTKIEGFATIAEARRIRPVYSRRLSPRLVTQTLQIPTCVEIAVHMGTRLYTRQATGRASSARPSSTTLPTRSATKRGFTTRRRVPPGSLTCGCAATAASARVRA